MKKFKTAAIITTWQPARTYPACWSPVDTAEEVLALAPSVAGALIASLQAEGDLLPATIHSVSTFPLVTHVAVTA